MTNDGSMERLLDDLFTYHPPTEEQRVKYASINEAAKALGCAILTHCPACPDRDDAIRKLRDARMTANASIATKSGGRIG